MEEISVTNGRRRFGALLKRVQKAPVSITRRNNEVAVVISASTYAELLARAGRNQDADAK